MKKIITLVIGLCLAYTARCQFEQDSIVGYVMPWINERGQIVFMNTMLMDIRNVEFDTLDFYVQLRFPVGREPYFTTVHYTPRDSVRFVPTLGLNCYAIKSVDQTYGLVWEMRMPNNQPLEALLVRGYRTIRTVQTGQR